MATRFVVGGSCDAWCTKCKLILEHRIIAMDGTKPKRVECTTCKGHHNFRADAPGTRASTTRKRATSGSRTTKTRTTRRGSWSTLVGERDQSAARPYKISATFEEEELIDHSRFGMGIVMNAMPGKKIEVLFEDGKKLLVHSR